MNVEDIEAQHCYIKTYAVGTHLKCLCKALLMSAHNICIYGEIIQEAHGPRLAHLSDITTADMQMLCNIFPILSSQQ